MRNATPRKLLSTIVFSGGASVTFRGLYTAYKTANRKSLPGKRGPNVQFDGKGGLNFIYLQMKRIFRSKFQYSSKSLILLVSISCIY